MFNQEAGGNKYRRDSALDYKKAYLTIWKGNSTLVPVDAVEDACPADHQGSAASLGNLSATGAISVTTSGMLSSNLLPRENLRAGARVATELQCTWKRGRPLLSTPSPHQ
jgi:hypothetical protein